LPRRDLCDDALDSDAFAEAAEKLVVPRTDHGRFVALDGSACGEPQAERSQSDGAFDSGLHGILELLVPAL